MAPGTFVLRTMMTAHMAKVLIVEDEHDLRALLDQEPAANRLDGHVASFGVLPAVPHQEAADHHLFTESSLLWHPRSTLLQR